MFESPSKASEADRLQPLSSAAGHFSRLQDLIKWSVYLHSSGEGLSSHQSHLAELKEFGRLGHKTRPGLLEFRVIWARTTTLNFLAHQEAPAVT